MSYRINFNNGAGLYEESFEQLAEAKIAAISMMGFTGSNVEIVDEEGQIVTISYWVPIEPIERDFERGIVLVQFGSEGYYLVWSDELEFID